MALYESTFIARQDISAQDVEKLTVHFTDIVKEHGGKAIKDEYWGLRALAYRVNKARKGHYVMLCLDASAEAIGELERQYRLHEDVVRFLTVRVKEIGKDASPMMQSGAAEAA